MYVLLLKTNQKKEGKNKMAIAGIGGVNANYPRQSVSFGAIKAPKGGVKSTGDAFVLEAREKLAEYHQRSGSTPKVPAPRMTHLTEAEIVAKREKNTSLK